MMIPPAGRERDLLIAAMKGIKPVFACYVDDILGDSDYCVLDDDKPSDCRICEREKITNKESCLYWQQRSDGEWLSDWSIDRNDAMKLFVEMPYEIRHKAIQKWDETMYGPDNFAPIVSSAWIEWKEDKL